MVTIKVSVSTKYEVKVGQGLLGALGQEAAAVIPGRAAVIVSDSNVWTQYGKMATVSLEQAGFQVHAFVMEAGEASKNGENYLKLLEFLAEKGVSRADCLVALGGGVVGDLTGFAAATYLRGVAYIQVPTTLLAMVDSSVGGKTAINLTAGKNLAGAFYQPKLVLCDISTLDTLPQAVFTEGCAEVIKYAVLYDAALFAHLEEQGPDFHREQVIAQCIEWKKRAVTEDEFDFGSRRMLNLGHTIGHSIEKCSDYTISHGAAVAIGMSIIARSAAAKGLSPRNDCQRITALLAQFGLPTATQLPLETLIQQAFSDKKRSGYTITLVFPATIGCGKLMEMPISQLEHFVKEGM